MNPTRRRFLASASALTAATLLPGCADKAGGGGGDSAGPEPTPAREPEPDAWAPAGTLDEAAFAWGVQVGDAAADSAIVSVRTTEPGVTLVLAAQSGDSWAEIETISDVAPSEGTAQVELAGLAADTAYSVVAYSADGARRSAPTRFRTALGEGGWRKVVFGATSCLGTVNTGYASLERAAEQKLDFVLLLGDAIYADGAVTIEDYRAKWAAALSHPAVRALLGSTSAVAAWDDHEVNNNWVLGENVTEEQLATATAAFREALPQRSGDGGGMWRSLRWGDALEVFVLDCRGERDWETRIVSDEQLAWITAAVQASGARFKIVLSSVHLTDHTDLFATVEQEDRWQGYPDQRAALVAALEATPGALVLTGDMHYGALQRLSPPGQPGAGLWEIAAGPAGSRVLEVVGLYEETEQYPVLVADWSYAWFEADPGAGTIRVRLVTDDGTVVAEELLTL